MADAKNFSGTIAADAQAVTLSPNGRPVVAIELAGTWTANLDVKIKIDGTEQNAVIVTSAGAAVSLPLTTNQIAFVDAVGCEQVIVRANGFTSGTANVYLNATDGKLPQATAGSAVSISDGSDATFGAKADASAAADNSTATYMSLFKRLLARLTTLLPQNSGRLNVDGAGGTFPVTNANLDAATSTLLTISDFDTKTGSLTETAPATDTASSGVNGRLQRVAQRLSSLITLLPTALGTTTAAGSLPVALSSDGTYATLQGGVTETAPATDIASSGANGRLQRIAQNITTLIAAILKVQGTAAVGAGATGNPLQLGAADTSSNMAYLRCLAGADGASNAALELLAAGFGYDSNGTSWDRHRNNVDVTLLASAARTTLQNSANITVYNCKGIIVTLDVTATVSTVSLTPSINYIDPGSGKAIPLLTGTTVAAAGTTTYWVDEAALASVPAPFTKTAQAALGRIITINIAVGNANSQTYSVGYTLIP